MKRTPKHLLKLYRSIRTIVDLREFIIGKPSKENTSLRIFEYKTDIGKVSYEVRLDLLQHRLSVIYANSLRLNVTCVEKLVQEHSISEKEAKALCLHKVVLLADATVETACEIVFSKLGETDGITKISETDDLCVEVFDEALQKAFEENALEPLAFSDIFTSSDRQKPKIKLGRPKRKFNAPIALFYILKGYLVDLAREEKLSLRDLKSGDVDFPKITAKRFAEEGFPFSRRTLYKWLKEADNTFEGLLDQAIRHYIKTSQELLRNRSGNSQMGT